MHAWAARNHGKERPIGSQDIAERSRDFSKRGIRPLPLCFRTHRFGRYRAAAGASHCLVLIPDSLRDMAIPFLVGRWFPFQQVAGCRCATLLLQLQARSLPDALTTFAPPPWRWTARSHEDAVRLKTRPSQKDTKPTNQYHGLGKPRGWGSQRCWILWTSSVGLYLGLLD